MPQQERSYSETRLSHINKASVLMTHM